MPIHNYMHFLSNKTKCSMVLDVLEKEDSIALKFLYENVLDKNQRIDHDFMSIFSQQYFSWLKNKNSDIDLTQYKNDFFLGFQHLLIQSLKEQINKDSSLTYNKLSQQYGLFTISTLDKNIVLNLAQKHKEKTKLKWLTEIMQRDDRGMLSSPVILTQDNTEMIKANFFKLSNEAQMHYLTKSNIFDAIKDSLPKDYLNQQEALIYSINYNDNETDVTFQTSLILNNLKQKSSSLSVTEYVLKHSTNIEKKLIKSCLERNVTSNIENLDRTLIFINAETKAKFEYLETQIKLNYVENCKLALGNDLQNLCYYFRDIPTTIAYQKIENFVDYYLEKSNKKDILVSEDSLATSVDSLCYLGLFEPTGILQLVALLKLSPLNDRKQNDKQLIQKYISYVIENKDYIVDCFDLYVANPEESKLNEEQVVNQIITKLEKIVLEWGLENLSNIKSTSRKLKI